MTRTLPTRRQRDVYAFIVEFWERKQRAPTFREVADHFGYRALSTVYEHVDGLRRLGYLDRSRYNEAGCLIPIRERCPACGQAMAEGIHG